MRGRRVVYRCSKGHLFMHGRLGDQEQTAVVEDGFSSWFFDDVPEQEFRPYALLRESLAGSPKVVECASG
jgi:hypothetical protein